MAEFLRALPLPPRPAPVRVLPLLARWQRLWFPSRGIGVLSLLLAAALLAGGWHFLQWALVQAHWQGSSSEACVGDQGACWAFVRARWKPWLVGPYPDGQLWR